MRALDELFGIGYDAQSKFEGRINGVSLDEVRASPNGC